MQTTLANATRPDVERSPGEARREESFISRQNPLSPIQQHRVPHAHRYNIGGPEAKKSGCGRVWAAQTAHVQGPTQCRQLLQALSARTWSMARKWSGGVLSTWP